MGYLDRITEFSNITVTPEEYGKSRITGKITLETSSGPLEFRVVFTYSDDIEVDRNLAGLVLTMPVINFTLFSMKLTLDFPVSKADLDAIREFVKINNREVFVNKLARRRYEFYRKEYLPSEEDITPQNADGITEVIANEHYSDRPFKPAGGSAAVFSSGGKESLLSYGMLKELDPETHAFFFNESGFHWLPAKTAHDYYISHFKNVHKVWSNVDRFYRFVLRHMKIIDQKMVNSKTDTYPVQLFIFPVYIMSMVPVALKTGISGAVLGDEFDDPREMPPFHAIKHYYEVYDQTHDFNSFISDYFHRKGIDFTVWSAVYPINGSVVEKILVNRYPELFRLQRSCHSCRNVGGRIVPCGVCSKCLGILLFVLNAGGDPRKIEYSEESIRSLKQNVEKERMKLDPDELNLMKSNLGFIEIRNPEKLQHVPGIHILPDEEIQFQKVPGKYRDGILGIVRQYSGGIYILSETGWVPVN